MRFKFTKMEALGNDYVYVDLLENQDLVLHELIKVVPKISDRHRGIGGDGVIVISKGEKGELWTRIFNADGSEAESCGNGLRCVARIVFDNGYTDGKDSFDVYLKKTNRKVHSVVRKDSVTVDMGEAVVGQGSELEYKRNLVKYIPVNIGNPHAVIFESNLGSLNIEAEGSFIENHKDFPNRTNVEFVNIVSPEKIKLRVWERGAAETFACGSGACASVAAAISKGLCSETVEVTMRGGVATVSKVGISMHLTGPVSYVFKGESNL